MDLSRRQLIGSVAGGTVLLGAGRAVYNVLLGYDRFTGTNLLRQDLDPLVAEHLSPSEPSVATVDGYEIEQDDGTFTLREPEAGDPVATLDPATDDPEDAAAVDDDYDLPGGPLEQLVADLGALDAGDVRFEYDSYPTFFDRIRDAEDRSFTVAALRGRRSTDPETVEAFAEADPADPEAVAEGLVEGFREHTNYDVERYVAGSIEDNVIFGRRDLRQHFESPTDFEAMIEGEDSGLFCYELTRRSVEALQATPATEQTTPVFAGFVQNSRHKHVYTVVASALREDGEFVVPVTFLDYTDSTLYDDFRLRRILGEGLDAYDDGHRATNIAWYRS